ncbi:MAG: class I SAM-dependent methyltransferase [Actinomycetota bacterium]
MAALIPRDQWPRPNLIGRLRSRQAGRPSGPLGLLMGRAMAKDTWVANERNLSIVTDRLGGLTDRTVLELGFGQGRMVGALLDAGATVLGVEVSTTMRAQASRANREAVAAGRADLRIGDGIRLPFDDGVADAVTTAHTIYFLPEPERTMADVHRVLGPEGVFTLAFVSAENGVAPWMDPAVYRAYLTEEVTTMLTEAGFSAVEVVIDDGLPLPLRWMVATA